MGGVFWGLVLRDGGDAFEPNRAYMCYAVSIDGVLPSAHENEFSSGNVLHVCFLLFTLQSHACRPQRLKVCLHQSLRATSAIMWEFLQRCAALLITSARRTFVSWMTSLRETRGTSLYMMVQVRHAKLLCFVSSLTGWISRSESPESVFMGFPIQERPSLVQQANPVAYASLDVPPVLIVHGNEDALVPHHQSRLLHAALTQQRQSGQKLETGPWLLHIVEGGGHGERFDEDHQLIDLTFDFLEKYLKGCDKRSQPPEQMNQGSL